MGWLSFFKGFFLFGGKGFVLLLSKLRTTLLFLVITVILINAVIISIETGSIEPGIKEVGNRFLLVTETLGEQSREIIQNQGTYNPDDSFFKAFLDFSKNFYNIFESIIIIYFWMKIFTLLIMYTIISDSSKQTASFLVAIIIFFAMQIIFILAFTDKSITAPFNAFMDFARAIPYIFKPAVKIVSQVSGQDLVTNVTTNSS